VSAVTVPLLSVDVTLHSVTVSAVTVTSLSVDVTLYSVTVSSVTVTLLSADVTLSSLCDNVDLSDIIGYCHIIVS